MSCIDGGWALKIIYSGGPKEFSLTLGSSTN